MRARITDMLTLLSLPPDTPVCVSDNYVTRCPACVASLLKYHDAARKDFAEGKAFVHETTIDNRCYTCRRLLEVA